MSPCLQHEVIRGDDPASRNHEKCECTCIVLKAFQDANVRKTFAGWIVLSIGYATKSNALLGLEPHVKMMLDELHKRKIDMCNEILVLNVGGYVGSSTASEIAYTVQHGKYVRWLEKVAA